MVEKDKAVETKSSAASRLGDAVNAYVAQAIASQTDLSLVREELATTVGFELANRMVQRIALGRNAKSLGAKYVEVPVRFDACRNLETR